MQETTQNQLFCQVVGRLLIADGLLTDEESEFMTHMFESLEITPQERSSIIEGIDIDSDLDTRLASLDTTQLQFLISLLKEAASIDGDVVLAEQSVIARVHAFLLSNAT